MDWERSRSDLQQLVALLQLFEPGNAVGVPFAFLRSAGIASSKACIEMLSRILQLKQNSGQNDSDRSTAIYSAIAIESKD